MDIRPTAASSVLTDAGQAVHRPRADCDGRKAACLRLGWLTLSCCLLLGSAAWERAGLRSHSPSSRLVTAAALGRVDTHGRSVSIKLLLHRTNGTVTRLWRPLRAYFSPGAGTCLDVSSDRRWLAYDDPDFRIHLVNLSTGRSMVIEKGFRPMFSADGKYLAYLVAEEYPVGTPGVQGFLRVYSLGTRVRKTVGTGATGYLYSDYAWSTHGHRLLWQINLLKGGAHQKRPNPAGPLWVGFASADRPGAVTVIHPPGRRGDLIRPGRPPDVRSDGGFTWTYGGHAVLYWRWRGASNHDQVNRWALTEWRLPRGPARTLAVLASWLPKDVGSVPPPFVAGHGLVATLLPGPATMPHIVRILDQTSHLRSVHVTGAPIAGVFEPGGEHFAVVVGRDQSKGVTFMEDVDVVTRHSASVKRVPASVFARWTAVPPQG